MGRHSQPAHRRASSRTGAGDTGRSTRARIALASAIVVILGGGLLGVKLTQAAPDDANACGNADNALTVGADPEALDWLRDLAGDYNDAERRVEGRCVHVTVNKMDASLAQQALQAAPYPGGGEPPAVWVPHSTTLLDLVRSRPGSAAILPATATSIASSPLVLAGPPVATRPLQSVTAPDPGLGEFLAMARPDAGWSQVGRADWGPLRFSVVNPSTSTMGTSLLIGIAAASTRTAPTDVTTETFRRPEAQAALLQFVRATAVRAGSAEELLEGFRKLADPNEAVRKMGFLALTERDVWRYNKDSPLVPLQALYPFGGALAADFPYVVASGNWVSDFDKRAAEDFRRWLMEAETQESLPAKGVRPASGAGFSANNSGLDTEKMAPGAVKAPGTPATARASWKLLTQQVSTLAVMDVSGSMAEQVEGTGKSRLELAVQAAVTALPLYADADRTGLWEFSTNLTPEADYRELVPALPASGTYRGKPVRQALADAYRAMEPRQATGLYDSVLAAYDSALENYQPDYVNTVVVLTDGENEDDDSISLDDLLNELEERQDDTRPVHIITIGYGDQADNDVLARIAEATSGLHFPAPDPRQIGQVFLTALTSLSS